MSIKNIMCNIKAVPAFLKMGIWCPHLYAEVEQHKGIIIATKDSFRESTSLQHDDNEIVYTNATITKMKCVDCGKEYIEWYKNPPRILR